MRLIPTRFPLPLLTRGANAAFMTATIHRLSKSAAPSLDPMIALVASGMNQVNAVILDRMQSQIPLIPELSGHLIASGGKRMRPMLTLATSALLDYPGTRQYKLAASVEFIHTATLLHDDVVDHSDLRRGRKTANVIWGARSPRTKTNISILLAPRLLHFLRPPAGFQP